MKEGNVFKKVICLEIMLEPRDLLYVIDAHVKHSKEEKNSVRFWDGRTPYYVHPFWCASMILHETRLPENLRREGSRVLLYHDILEDTTSGLPEWLTKREISLINGMTFESSEDEWKNLWGKTKEVRLLKVYDKTANLMDGIWMKEDRREQHRIHLRKLI